MAKNANENKMLKQLRAWGACEDGYAFSAKSGAKTLSELWDKLERPDWMFWLIEKAEIKLDDKNLRLFACACAEQVLPIFEKKYPKDKRPRQAIETARRFAGGKATAAELRAACDSARASGCYPSAWAASWDAIFAADFSAAAAVSDFAASQSSQADLLRTMLGNPFERGLK